MDNFWTIIDNARQGNQSADPEKVKAQLLQLPTEEAIAFLKEFERHHLSLNLWSVWGAGYVMAGGMGDDSFHYFKAWLIGRGEEAVQTALANPDDLGKFADPEDEFDNELLQYAIFESLEERGVDPDPHRADNLEDMPTGEEWDEDEVYEKFPKLAAKFE